MCMLVGGCETFSDVPIRFSKPIRQRMLQMPKVVFMIFSNNFPLKLI